MSGYQCQYLVLFVLHCSLGCFNWSHLFEGQLARQFETHHHHTSNPEEQDVVACLKQGARVEDIQVLVLKKPRTLILSQTSYVGPLNCTLGFFNHIIYSLRAVVLLSILKIS